MLFDLTRAPAWVLGPRRDTCRGSACEYAIHPGRHPPSCPPTVATWPASIRQARCFRQGDGHWAVGANCAAEKHRAWGRARSALRALTRCTCSTTASAASGGSCAPGPKTEHRRAPSRSEGERRLSPGSPVPVALLAHRRSRRSNCRRWRTHPKRRVAPVRWMLLNALAIQRVARRRTQSR